MVRFDKSKLLVFNLFLLLQGCVRLSFGNDKTQVPDKVLDPIGDEIHQALSILESSGISTEFLCHNGDEQLDSLLPQCLDGATYTRFLHEEHEEESHVKKTKWYYIKNVLMVIFCVTCAAMAAGLTMGLLSLEVLDLKIKEMAAKSDKDRESARKILPLMEDYHRLLVTLLLLNSFSNEALPIFLDALVPSYMAVIISVTLVLFFGEIIPTAIFAGPNKLAVASSFAWFVKFLLFIFAPLAVSSTVNQKILIITMDECLYTWYSLFFISLFPSCRFPLQDCWIVFCMIMKTKRAQQQNIIGVS